LANAVGPRTVLCAGAAASEGEVGARACHGPFFEGLLAGEFDALVGSFAGEPELHHPVRGRIRGAQAFEKYAIQANAWLRQRKLSVEDIEHVVGPTIEFARNNLAIPWSDDYASLLELAEACDVPVRWSCRTGVCHDCETTLIAGSVDYNPDLVEPPADGSALICCSRPHDDVVLDL
jgi:ferredoxin